MKKRAESGKNFQNKSLNNGVDLWHQGEHDAYHNLGCNGGRYRGHLKKCYMNGYKEGQTRRAFEKQRHAG
jgi:hypothetical protein